MSAEVWAVLAVGVSLAGLNLRMSQRLEALARDVAELRERVARIEGLLEGWLRREPWHGPDTPEGGS